MQVGIQEVVKNVTDYDQYFTTIPVTLYVLVQFLVRICAKHCMFTGKAGKGATLNYSKETDSLEVEKLFPMDNSLPLEERKFPNRNSKTLKETIVAKRKL